MAMVTRFCRRGALALALAALSCAALASPAACAELLVLERAGCIWCTRWNDEIAPAYPHTSEGRVAPLRRVDITQPWPKDLAGIAPDRLTPTFILTEHGREVARMHGYPGPDFFWPLLDEMLAKLDKGQTKAAKVKAARAKATVTVTVTRTRED